MNKFRFSSGNSRGNSNCLIILRTRISYTGNVIITTSLQFLISEFIPSFFKNLQFYEKLQIRDSDDSDDFSWFVLMIRSYILATAKTHWGLLACH